MTEPDIEQVLSRARRVLSPGDADMLRVQASLPPELLNGVGMAAAEASATAPLRWWQVPAGTVLLGVAGVVGYGWGYSDGVAVNAVSVVAPAVVTREPNPVASASPPISTPPVIVAPASSVSAARTSVPRAPAVVARTAPPPGLDEEVRQLRRIEKALRDGNPRLALAIGDNLDAALPQGQLREERSAARLMAQCQIGDERAAQQAQKYIADNAQSAYAERLRQICKP